VLRLSGSGTREHVPTLYQHPQRPSQPGRPLLPSPADVHPGLAPDDSALVAKGFPFAVGRIGGSGFAAAVAQRVKCRGEYNVRC
jgi:hypothetical protein